jgi:1,4-alpha-glucan branching enzyme
MRGYFALVLHAHLPFVRHPEHAKFLEENWLFEAITEAYLPLLELFEEWRRDGLNARLTLTLSPTLCSMLQDALLQERYLRYLNELIDLAENEIHRTRWQKPFHELALFYCDRYTRARTAYQARGGDLVGAFRTLQESGSIEIITSAATHAVLPLLELHPPSVRAQVLVARDHYRACFGVEPRGIWLPECAYSEAVEAVLQEANLRWFILDTHGLLLGRPRPRFAVFAPVFTPRGLAVFGRDNHSARQVWSRQGGYPGDPRYRDFYRDIGYDLDLDYLEPHLGGGNPRGFTGFKYHRITQEGNHKEVYERAAARQATEQHAEHFLQARLGQIESVEPMVNRPPILVAPYDAELFGHWWYEGPEFLDFFVRKACRDHPELSLITPQDYLQQHPINQVVQPSPSSWGQGGYWQVWLNEQNQWIYPQLNQAQRRMSELTVRLAQPTGLQERALRQAARELLLAQASDWPFILRAGTSPGYARRRVEDHLLGFTTLYQQLIENRLDEPGLCQMELKDNIFPEVNYRLWRPDGSPS